MDDIVVSHSVIGVTVAIGTEILSSRKYTYIDRFEHTETCTQQFGRRNRSLLEEQKLVVRIWPYDIGRAR
jgi:hypothetical protein